MNTRQRIFPILLAMLLLCLPLVSFAEETDTQTVPISNTPIKGQILLEKTGLQKTSTYLGEPTYAQNYLKDAVFEIHAAEDIVGREGTRWYQAGELAATMKTSGEGPTLSPLLSLGKYTIQESIAPSGYVLDPTVYTVELKAADHQTPVITATVASVNDPAEILLRKTDRDGNSLPGARFGLFNADDQEIDAAISDAEGMVRFTLVPHGKYTIRETHAPDGYLLNRSGMSVSVTGNWTNSEQPIATVVDQRKQVKFLKTDTSGSPMAGILFYLINADTNTLVEKAVCDENGAFTFTKFDYGTWIVREAKTPEGYCRMPDYRFVVDDSWTEPAPIPLVNIPNHYEFIKTDASGVPLAGVSFVLLDEDGTVLREAESDENGVVRFDDLKPGTYSIKETATLQGYTRSGDVRKLVIDERYVLPEKMPSWINYTNIQTGVNLAVTGAMWLGVAMMAISGGAGLYRKRRAVRKRTH